jgi:small subunit ribosomal protein S16
VAVKIRLKRIGKTRAPHYRIVVADSRTHRDGRVIEEIGRYVPTTEPSIIEVNSERAQYWLSVGAQPTEQVNVILKLTGDLQASKGEKATNTVKPQAGKTAFVADAKKASVLLPKVEKSVKAEEAPAAEAPVAAVAEAPAEVPAEVPAEAPAEAAAEAPAEAAAEAVVEAPVAAEEAVAEVAEEAVAEVAEEAVAEVAEEAVAEVAEEAPAEAAAEATPVAEAEEPKAE